MSAEKELEKLKEIISCLSEGAYLRVTIIPYNGEFHVISSGRGRDVFTTHEAACKWASSYFILASNMSPAN
jgi:hypothetical protein